MCGICGIYQYDGRLFDEAVLARMSEHLRHRGPDGGGFWSAGKIGLGHRRLSIIDSEGGAQPIGNETGEIQICVNGEIYNHRELRRGLEQKGHVFKTRSDSEVIVHLYEEKGTRFLEELNGMFAIALWDARKDLLLLARDRLGIKPLVYHVGGGRLVFASELRSLLAHPEVPRELDPQALHLYFNHEFFPAQRPLLKGVKKLQPAEFLVLTGDGEPKLERYWEPGFAPKLSLTPEQAAQTFRGLLAGSVQKQLMSDVPLGAFLSGGIDSSSIVALMAAHQPGKVKTFSLGFDDRSYSELPYARLVAERFGTEHHEEVLRPDALQVVDVVLDHMDEPIADMAAIPTFLVSSFARKHVTVCLSGDGGDELLAGYDRHLASQICEKFYRHLPGTVRGFVEPLAATIAGGSGKKNAADMLRRFVEGAAKDPRGRQMRWQSFMSPEIVSSLYTAEMQSQVRGMDAFDAVARILSGSEAAGLDQELELEQRLYLPDDILMKTDWMSMAVSLEVRVPFLDHELVDFVNRLPAGMKRRWNRGKLLLHDAMRDELPPAILKRRKQGFGIPLKGWLQGPLFERVDAAFSRSSGTLDRFIDRRGARALLAAHQKRQRDYTHQIWSAFVLCEWAERNLGRL
ncbi:asparagine synthase (glutamine-hydrolyzing) [Geomonas nitrogeniifigens]|uniref:asparagine synthase (glutamine-hydrolyzing) n=1 Tax=Geomonas diazotrophica TaxID=2843197 RepID=A0ABX8JC09_9BACT|nr:asparagine synthase (glutamine-hydrolyzing) [Geomonas nitrogeniifigens]QWV95944.1 asparagine synthase (glutamine-hydrolyzing) [Geomonas nitrogeniifigens]